MNTPGYYTLGTLTPPQHHPTHPFHFLVYTHTNLMHTHTGSDRKGAEHYALMGWSINHTMMKAISFI